MTRWADMVTHTLMVSEPHTQRNSHATKLPQEHMWMHSLILIHMAWEVGSAVACLSHVIVGCMVEGVVEMGYREGGLSPRHTWDMSGDPVWWPLQQCGRPLQRQVKRGDESQHRTYLGRGPGARATCTQTRGHLPVPLWGPDPELDQSWVQGPCRPDHPLGQGRVVGVPTLAWPQ